MWQGLKRGKGYGSFFFEGKNMYAHRVSYLLFKGPIPDGLFVLHHCDNRCCVNPAHLFLGTHNDNIADMVAKGRTARWDKKASTKLTPRLVEVIRKAEGSSRFLGALFDVCHSTIQAIKKNKKWIGVQA